MTVSGTTSEPFSVVIQAEAFTVADITRSTVSRTTQARTLANPEPGVPARDSDGDRLWDGATGDGYMDMGADVGDRTGFTIDAPAAGTYTLMFRYANGGAAPNAARPMTLSVGGVETGVVAFAGTGAGRWDNWTDVSVEVQLVAGSNVISLANTVPNGPNIDRVTISSNDVRVEEPASREVIAIDFDDGPTSAAPGYLVDSFQGYGVRAGGLSYGWVTEASVLDADNTTATPINPAEFPAGAVNKRTGGVFDTFDARLTGYAHFDLPTYDGKRTAWEVALGDGWYEVTIAVGDTGGPNESVHRLLVENVLASSFTPTDSHQSELVTVAVEVTDGRLTLSQPEGSITKIQYIEIRELPDLTPDDGRAAPLDYASFDQPRAVGGVGGGAKTVSLGTADGAPASDVDPTSDIFLGVNIVQGRGGISLDGLNDGSIRLFETLTGAPVAFSANTTAGFDALTISPTSTLDPLTSYTLVIDGLRDQGPASDSAQRAFQKFSTTFTTGAPAKAVEGEVEVAFRDTVEVNGAADGAFTFSSIELSPDGRHLYATTLGGEIKRWDVSQTDGSLSGEQTLALPHFAGEGEGGRAIIGLAFDPANPSVLWISDNYAVPLNGRDNDVPNFSGRISKVTIEAGEAFTGTAETYVSGLPRSVGDHLSNSLEFRVNPNAGQAGEPSHLLYITQGSNTATGRADSAWNFRDERLLSGAVLEIDPTRSAPAGGFNVQTEPNPANTMANNASIFNADGTVTGFYNPFAPDAVLTLFATGTRNAYDLVWHSNGYLYVPTNGSAAGGNTPDDPTTPTRNEALTNAGLQNDYLFRVEDGGYYGHPNALRDEYVLNGGNLTAAVDRNEVIVSGERAGYAVGVAPDSNYRADSAYSLGTNRSPNGTTEYTSNVFGDSLKGAVLFAEYSGGNDIRAITLDDNGFTVDDFVLKRSDGTTITYTDPLDVIENPRTGQLYVVTLDRATGQSQIIRLDPTPGGSVDPSPPLVRERVLLTTIQAEDNTPGDDTSVTAASAAQGGQIQIRTTANPEPGSNATLVGGLRPGAFGLDGNTVNTDGVAGGYADFGSTTADFLTFTLNVTAEQAGAAVLVFRYANGDSPTELDGGARPLAVVVNGITAATPDFTPGAGATANDRLNNWQTVEVAADLVAGVNTIRMQATTRTGPNIDQVQIFRVVETSPPPTGVYEAELAIRSPGVVVADANPGFSGTGVADYLTGVAGDPNPELTFNVSVATAGVYDVQIRYTNPTSAGPRPLAVEVNGAAQGTLPFAPSGPASTDYGVQTASLTLQAGPNTISLTAPGGVGPDIDHLRVPSLPSSQPFTPSYADVPFTEAGARIDLQATDSTARVLNGTAAEFYFKVAADGAYAVDLASNGVVDGGGLTLLLNGVEVADVDFPDATETTAYLQLEGGVNYTLRAVSDLDGASALDYLDVRRSPGGGDADLVVQSLDPAYFDNRLHFSWIQDPRVPAGQSGVTTDQPDRVFKDDASVRLTNDGTTPLSVLDFELDGPFKLANPTQLDGLTIAPGQSVTVRVLFDRPAYVAPTRNHDAVSTVFEGALRLVTNDADSPVATIDLAGFWQLKDEGGQEPNVNEIFRVFGFGNRIEGLSLRGGGQDSVLDRQDRYESSDPTEVLSPYWRLADGVESARITQLAAFHGPGGATVGIHGPGNKGNSNQVQFWNHDGLNNQSILPLLSNSTGAFATRAFSNSSIPDAWVGNEVFGIEVAGFSSDPRLNERGPILVAGVQQGYTLRMFQAVDATGAPIANTFLGIQDYVGINYDYNDNVILIEGVTPVGFGAEIEVVNLDGAPFNDRLVMSRVETPANAAQEFHDTAVIRVSNPGAAALQITSLTVADPTAFEVVGGTAARTIAAGGFLDVAVRFIGVDGVNDDRAVNYESQLVIVSNDFDEGTKRIELAGVVQLQSEQGEEPTVQQIVDAFGYSTRTGSPVDMNRGGLVEALTADEVLSPYFVRASAAAPITITQLAAYHGQGDVARLFVHDVDGRALTLVIAHDEQDGQTLLPRTLNGGDALSVATLTRSDPFGFFTEVEGRQGFIAWSDPDANLYEDSRDAVGPRGANLNWDQNDGHLFRTYVAKDANGAVIPNTFIVVQDYGGVNYDYNDNVFLVTNVRSYDPSGVEDADRNGRVDIYDDVAGGGVPDPVAGLTQSPFGGTPPAIGATSAPVTTSAALFDLGGQGVAFNDTTPTVDQGGTSGRNEGVDILRNNEAIGWISAGEWVEYTIDVRTAGAYTLSFNTAATESGRSIVASFAQGGTVYATAPTARVADTDNFNSFADTSPAIVDLQAGVQVVRLTFSGGAFNLASFTLDRTAPDAAALRIVQTLDPVDPTDDNGNASFVQTMAGDALILSGDDVLGRAVAARSPVVIWAKDSVDEAIDFQSDGSLDLSASLNLAARVQNGNLLQFGAENVSADLTRVFDAAEQTRPWDGAGAALFVYFSSLFRIGDDLM